VAIDESANKIYAPLNVGRLSAAGLREKIGLALIDGDSDKVVKMVAPSKDLMSYFSAVTDMYVDPQTSRLFMAAENDAVLVIDTQTLDVKSLMELPSGSKPKAIAVNPGSGKVYTANSGDGTVSVLAGY
jgi:DNA-binding beta-propeller fold protein YncE